MSYERELETGLAAVKLASQICQSVQSQITAEALEKKDKSPVTIADYSSQAVICRILQEEFPDDPVIGEEDAAELRLPENSQFLERMLSELNQAGVSADAEQACGWIDRGGASDYSDRFWTLDPIDGTKGFLRGEQYAVSLALIVKGQIQVAVVGCPNLPILPGSTDAPGSVFSAIRGEGAQAHPLIGGASIQLSVSSTTDSREARFCESVESGHSSHDHSAQVAEKLGITQIPVRMDSQAKYTTVARGEAEVYLRLPTRPGYVEKIWDHAGGVLVVEEAGGTVTDITGKPLNFTKGRGLSENRGVVVSNGPFHQDILAALKEVGVT